MAAAVAAGMEQQLVADTVSELVSQQFWTEHGASPHLVAMIAESLNGSFATFEGVDGATPMQHGTGAGNPLADLLFTIAFHKLFARLRKRFLEAPAMSGAASAVRGRGRDCRPIRSELTRLVNTSNCCICQAVALPHVYPHRLSRL